MSADVTSTWVSVGQDRTFWRLELYDRSWAEGLPSLERVSAAPFGGPILILEDQLVRLFTASGLEMSCFRWKNASIISFGWSTAEEAVFICEEGSVFCYDLHGNLVRMFSMGQEAKDLKVADAKVFRSRYGTGVAVLTKAKRFFLVNNVEDPKVRKLPDSELPSEPVWEVVAGDERHAKVAVVSDEQKQLGTGPTVTLLSLAGVNYLRSEHLSANGAKVIRLMPNPSGSKLVVLHSDGLVWVTDCDGEKIGSFSLPDGAPDDIAWCSKDAMVAIYPSLCQAQIATLQGDRESLFLMDFLCLAQEADGVRLLTSGGQDFVQEVPDCVLNAHVIGGVHPAALLKHASEEFTAGSHRADDYLREITTGGGEGALDDAIVDCVEAAGHVWSPEAQKELLRAAQFGKSFQSGSSTAAADVFTRMCLNLRVLNSLRSRRIGVPMTIAQFKFLTPEVSATFPL